MQLTYKLGSILLTKRTSKTAAHNYNIAKDITFSSATHDLAAISAWRDCRTRFIFVREKTSYDIN
jgi:hypothetical protein